MAAMRLKWVPGSNGSWGQIPIKVNFVRALFVKPKFDERRDEQDATAHMILN